MIVLEAAVLFFIIINISQGKKHNYKGLYKISRVISKPLLSKMNHCFLEKSQSVVLSGNWSDADLHNIYSFNYISIILLNEEESENVQHYTSNIKQYALNPAKPLFKPFPVNRFIIQQNLSLLKLSLHKLKNSIWWYNDGFYFMKDIKMYNSCQSAYDYLKISWEFNILSVIFLCQDLNSNVFFYTHNPYNDYAPRIWNKFSIHKDVNGQLFTVFNHEYKLKEDSAQVCQYLNFDKTSRLNKYPLQLVGVEQFYEQNKKSVYNISGVIVEGKILEALFTSLNVTVHTTPTAEYSVLSSSGVPNKMLIDLLSGKFDMTFLFNYERSFWKNALNSFIQAGMCYVTNKERIATSEYFLKIFSVSGFLTLLFISSLATVLFAVTLKRNLVLATIDVLRAIVGVATVRQPRKILHRTIFLYIIYLCMILNFYLQSTWFSLLTATPIYKRKIESITDLLENNYTVYTSSFYQQQYFDKFQNSTKIIAITDYRDCLKYLKQDTRAACARDCDRLRLHFYDGKQLRISEDHHLRYYYVFVFRDDFPLSKRITKTYRRLFQSGIISYLSSITELNNIKNKDSIFDKPEKITLKQLKFTFYFLLLIDASAIIIFSSEVICKLVSVKAVQKL